VSGRRKLQTAESERIAIELNIVELYLNLSIWITIKQNERTIHNTTYMRFLQASWAKLANYKAEKGLQQTLREIQHALL
jgi:hypothetical protein